MSVRCITFHAIERLQERRKLTHLLRHLNKIKKWGLPDTGDTLHNGYRYITRGGVLITVIPDKKTMKEFRENGFKERDTTTE